MHTNHCDHKTLPWHPLGDQAAVGYAASEDEAAAVAALVRQADFPWLFDVVQAYGSVGVFFDLNQTSFAPVVAELNQLLARVDITQPPDAGRLVAIPCCYAFGLDLARIAQHTGLTVPQVIERHAGTTYTVYAIGFCPGFPYLGYLPAELSGVPRLPSPRLRVEAGTVGLTGRQTGIYTEVRPGGWNIVGRTPLELVNVAAGYFPLRTGDRVRFEPIEEEEYKRLQGKRL